MKLLVTNCNGSDGAISTFLRNQILGADIEEIQEFSRLEDQRIRIDQ